MMISNISNTKYYSTLIPSSIDAQLASWYFCCSKPQTFIFMNKFLRVFAVLIVLSVISVNAFSQNESPVQLGADLMSRYIWRGVNLGGNGPSIQPWIKYNLTSRDSSHLLSIGAWGAYTFSQTSNQEVDLYVTYSYKNAVSLTVTDYFFPDYYPVGDRSKFFNYNKDSTCHIFEGIISFNGTEKVPFTLLFGMNFYGNDSRRINGNGSTGKIVMTKYIEVGYKRNIKGVDFNAFVGAAIDKPNKDRGEIGFYGNKTSGIINLGVKVAKSIQLSDKYSLPVQASLLTNPEAENIFMVFGISF
jgi:hypothetical protein